MRLPDRLERGEPGSLVGAFVIADRKVVCVHFAVDPALPFPRPAAL
jgi:hypothetical protein